MGEALTALAHLTPTLGHLHEDAHRVLATMDTAAHSLPARQSPRRSAPRTEPAGQRAAPGGAWHPSRPRPPRLLAEGGYPMPPLQLGESSRIAKANVELNVWSASNCFPWLRKEEVECKHIPLASAKYYSWKAWPPGFWWTQPSSNFNNYWELSCAKALCKALFTWVILLLEPATNGSMIPISQMRTLRQRELDACPVYTNTNGRAGVLKLQSGLQ